MNDLNEKINTQISVKCFRGGFKQNEIDAESNEQKEKLEFLYKNRRALLSEPHYELEKNLSIGEWIEDKNRVKLTRIRGKFIHQMGYCELDHTKMAKQYMTQDSDDENEISLKPKYENTVYLYPEEALFLIESSSLQINHKEIPLSIQQAYTYLLNDPSGELELNDYIVYSYLLRLGYIVRRPNTTHQTILLNKEISNEVEESSNAKKARYDDFEPDVQPLLSIDDWNMNTKDIFEKISITENVLLDQLDENTEECTKLFKYMFDVYMPNKKFKKSTPGEPMCKLIIAKTRDFEPNLKDLIKNCRECHNSNILYAFVDNGDVSFYNFSSINLPIKYKIP